LIEKGDPVQQYPWHQALVRRTTEAQKEEGEVVEDETANARRASSLEMEQERNHEHDVHDEVDAGGAGDAGGGGGAQDGDVGVHHERDDGVEEGDARHAGDHAGAGAGAGAGDDDDDDDVPSDAGGNDDCGQIFEPSPSNASSAWHQHGDVVEHVWLWWGTSQSQSQTPTEQWDDEDHKAKTFLFSSLRRIGTWRHASYEHSCQGICSWVWVSGIYFQFTLGEFGGKFC
jgi:hypothetical protein